MPPLSRRRFAGAAAAGLARAAQNEAGRPNVLIILADDLGWKDVGFHGSRTETPNLDRLARQGVQFQQFYSYPVCSPTRAGLMTGRSPMRFGVMYHVIRPWLRLGVPTGEHFMSQSFQAAGYQTSIIGKWHLGHARVSYLPNARGFDHFYGHVNGAIDYYTHVRDGGLDWQRNSRSVREEGYSTELLGREAVRLLQQRDRARPFFMYLAFNAPHAPLEAPPALLEKYSGIADKRQRAYAAMVDALDTAAGRVLDTIDREGIADNTLVLFFSDNGGPIGQGARNDPLRAGKGTTFEGGIRVPAVMRWPGGLRGGRELPQVMTVLDVFPTLAAAAGIKARNTRPFDGRDLWPSIAKGEHVPREDLFFAVGGGKITHVAVRHGDWKLVRILTDGRPADHLFRIDRDPNEADDLAAKEPALVKDLAIRIEKWRRLHPAEGTSEANVAPAGWQGPKEWAEAAER